MTPHFQNAGISIYAGDVREVLPILPDESVHCVVTSPPYWGLRDYGTASWEGGEAECDHLGPPRMSDKTGLSHPELKPREQILAEPSRLVPTPFRDICGKCGAVRIDSQLGLERTPEEYISKMVAVFREVKRIMRPDATLWLNMGDSYVASPCRSLGSTKPGNGGAYRTLIPKMDYPNLYKPKDLCGIPWMLAFALRSDGWYLRQEIIWSKLNPMPESVTDRCTKSHESIFLLAKSQRYYFDAEAIKEEGDGYGRGTGPGGFRSAKYQNNASFDNDAEVGSNGTHGHSFEGGRNKRSVWTIATQPFPEAHFATFPEDLIKPCILAGCSDKCCANCGAPWERVTEQYDTGKRQKMADGWDTGDGAHGTVHRDGREKGESGVAVMAERTLGFEPSCSCNAGTVPGVVLDPFFGSGTTGLVAAKLHCKCIGIELNPEYIQIAAKRLSQEVFDFSEVAL